MNNIVKISYTKEMKKSYIDYAMSVIVGRAIPDVRDGFKPVHRRILYAMSQLGLTPEKGYRKSARIVGDVLGKYHPHGDTAVYEAMVRLSQDFMMNKPLVDGHGNWGSIDGDSAAAMRYTEAKMEKITVENLNDMEKNVVDFIPNFDGEEKEPVILPMRFPNLLVNGAYGIAVGMTTNIPPHNYNETINGVIAYIKDNNISIKKLMTYIKGPDFPTGGIITNKDALLNMYETGEGKITTRAKINKEIVGKDRVNLIITQIPYNGMSGKKTDIIAQIDDMIRNKKLDELSEIRDESDRNGIRIVLEVKKDVDIEKLLNKLYSKTKLEDSKSYVFLAIVDGQPKILNLKEIISNFVDFQIEINLRKYKYLLNKLQNRKEILEGLIKAEEIIDLIIEILRGSSNVKIAKDCLINGDVSQVKFKTKKSKNEASKLCFTKNQADAILDMKLQKLIGLELDKLNLEYAELIKTMENYTDIINNKDSLMNKIVEELKNSKKKFGEKRKTELDNLKTEKYIEAQLIEDVYVLIDKFGYTKMIDVNSYNRASKESIQEYKYVFKTKNDDSIVIFTNKGIMYQLKLKDLQKSKIKDKGILMYNECKIDANEDILLVDIMQNIKNKSMIFLTKKGLIKNVKGKEFCVIRKSIQSTKLEEDDLLRNIIVLDETYELNNYQMAVVSKEGFVLKFYVNSIPKLKKMTIGIKSIVLIDEDYITSDYFIKDAKEECIIKINSVKIDLSTISTDKLKTSGTFVFN